MICEVENISFPKNQLSLLKQLKTVTPFSAYENRVPSILSKVYYGNNWLLHTTKVICEKKNKRFELQ